MFGRKLRRGIAVSPSFLSWVEVSNSKGQPVLVGSAMEELPEGLIVPSFARENISDHSSLKDIINKLIPGGKRSGDISLTIPDAVLKISFLNFDELPKKREEVERLILWRLKKSIPLVPEMAKVDYLLSPNENGSIDVISAVASRKVIKDYEDIFIKAGFKPRIVDVSSMNLLNFFGEQLKGVFLFLSVSNRSITISVVDNGQVKLFRYKELEIKEDRIVKEVFATLTYYNNNFSGNPLEEAYLFVNTEKINGQLDGRLGPSFSGHISLLSAESVMRQTEDAPISENLAAAIGGALRLK